MKAIAYGVLSSIFIAFLGLFSLIPIAQADEGDTDAVCGKTMQCMRVANRTGMGNVGYGVNCTMANGHVEYFKIDRQPVNNIDYQLTYYLTNVYADAYDKHRRVSCTYKTGNTIKDKVITLIGKPESKLHPVLKDGEGWVGDINEAVCDGAIHSCRFTWPAFQTQQ